MRAGIFKDILKSHGAGPFIEVPCSYLSPLISALMDDPSCETYYPANEAVAMGMASGAYLASGNIPVVIIQNSGLCNSLNAITSLNQIYGIPALLVISWRGGPGVKDAPEHDIMGVKTLGLLELFDIPYIVLSDDNCETGVRDMFAFMKSGKKPAAVVVGNGIFSVDKEGEKTTAGKGADKIEALAAIYRELKGKAFFVTTNGHISRQFFTLAVRDGLDERDPQFYMLGSMGHALPLGIGISNASRNGRKIAVIDGDGGCMMQMGAMASVREDRNRDLVYIVLDNNCYESTGSQPSLSDKVDFGALAGAFGFKTIKRVTHENELPKILNEISVSDGPSFLHILVRGSHGHPGVRVSDKYTCGDIKNMFMKNMLSCSQ